MRTYIKKIRAKPESIRKQYLVGAMVVSMTLVCSIWVYGLTTHFSTANTSQQIKADIKPFALFGEGLTSTYKDVTASAGAADTTQVDQGKMIPLIPVEPAAQ